jgi:glycerol-3-phosphate dehydrogenase
MLNQRKIDIQGHRGARGLFPENTITSFIEAVKLGVDTLEMDVVISKDMQVVVSHEAWMNEIFCTGGKLTGYRKMAQRVVDVVAQNFLRTEKRNITDCTTDKIQLSGGKINEGLNFSEFVKNKIQYGLSLGLSVKEAEKLANRYGSNIDEIYAIIENINKEESNLPVSLRAQLIYAIEKEMCVTPSDFFIRRTALLYFDIETVKKYKTEISVYMKNLFSWNDKLDNRFNAELEKTIREV